jgi:hypothetical protein
MAVFFDLISESRRVSENVHEEKYALALKAATAITGHTTDSLLDLSEKICPGMPISMIAESANRHLEIRGFVDWLKRMSTIYSNFKDETDKQEAFNEIEILGSLIIRDAKIKLGLLLQIVDCTN